MFFTTVIAILAILGGLVVIVAIGFAIAYFIMVQRLTARMRETVREMEEMLAKTVEASTAASDLDAGMLDSTCIPPLRIHLEDARLSEQVFGAHGARVDRWMSSHQFRHVGDFTVDELGGEKLRTFLSKDGCLLAAMRISDAEQEPYVEFCFDLGGGERGGVGNPPLSSVQLPEEAVGRFFSQRLSDDPTILDKMWLHAKRLVEAESVLPIDESRIPQFFEEAHAVEMDRRIRQGGLSEAEIRSALSAQGVEPTEEDVEELQEQWQLAIEKHLLDFSSRGLNHTHTGGSVLIVHDGSVTTYLLNRLRDTLDEMENSEDFTHEDVLDAITELRVLLERFSPREAIARFRPLLPIRRRFDLIDQLRFPVEADLYLLSESELTG